MNQQKNPLFWSFPIGTWFLTQVRVSVLLPIVVLLVCWRLENVQLGMIFAGVLFVSVLAHEFGHVLAARNTLARSDGSVLIAGETTIRDLNRRFGWNFPDEEAATIAGLALQLAQQIPQVSDRFEIDGFILDVRGRQKNRITSVRVIPPPSSETNAEEDA